MEDDDPTKKVSASKFDIKPSDFEAVKEFSAEILELFEKQEAVLSRMKATQEEIKKVEEQIHKFNKEKVNIEKEIAELEEKKTKTIRSRNMAFQTEEEKERLSKIIESTEKEIELLKEQVAEGEKLSDNSKKMKKDLSELDDINKDLEKSIGKTNKKIKQMGAEFVETSEEAKRLKRELDGIDEEVNTIQGAFKKGLGKGGGFLGEIYRSAESAMETLGQLESAKKNAGGFGKLISNSFNLLKTSLAKVGGAVAFSFIALGVVLAKMAYKVNKLSKELGAATGMGDIFNEEITAMAMSGNMAAIGFEQAASSLKALTDGLSSFNPKSEKTNIEVGLTVARLEKLGVSSGDSVKTIDLFQRTLGLTAEKASDTTAQIARMGKEIGISGTKMIQDFNAASSRLAIYGKNNIKVFKGLAAAAKASGIEMQSLISVSQQFDTFDKAADQVAKLNAVLGTQLSTLELMAASDEERIFMIKQQVQASVGNFDSLDKFTKMYIQQAMGVKDVAEAQRLLNMSTAEYQKYKQGQKEQADIQKEIAEASEKLVPLGQQLKLAFAQFALAFAPLVPIFTTLLKGAGWLLGWVAKIVAFIGPIVAFGFAFAKAAAAISAFVAGAASMATPVGWIIAAVAALYVVLTQIFDLFGMKINPLFVRIFHFLADGLTLMLSPITGVIDGLRNFGGALDRLFGIAKEDAADMVNNDSFNLQAVANIDMDRVAAGISKVKSALVELSSVKVLGMIAFNTDGTNTSMIMGSVATETAMLLSGGKLEVDVKIPEMKMPDVHVKVYIGDRELRDIIRSEIDGKFVVV